MFLQTKTLFLFTETPLHAGAGSGLGTVDLPIQRERPTGYPMIQASGVKGALRSEAGGTETERLAIFGPDTSNNITHAAALSMGDARILLFPIRSLTGIFAWATSMHVLSRFARDVSHSGLALPPLPELEPEPNQAFVSGNGVVAGDDKKTVVLEEYSFDKSNGTTANEQTAKIASWLADEAFPSDDLYAYWREKVKTSLVILPEDAFRDFVLNATEVITRIRLDQDSKTVTRGALWSEEHLPSDCLLYAPARATRLRLSEGEEIAEWLAMSGEQQAEAVLNWIADPEKIPHWMQIGGDETVGRGIVRLRWNGGTNE